MEIKIICDCYVSERRESYRFFMNSDGIQYVSISLNILDNINEHISNILEDTMVRYPNILNHFCLETIFSENKNYNEYKTMVSYLRKSKIKRLLNGSTI